MDKINLSEVKWKDCQEYKTQETNIIVNDRFMLIFDQHSPLSKSLTNPSNRILRLIAYRNSYNTHTEPSIGEDLGDMAGRVIKSLEADKDVIEYQISLKKTPLIEFYVSVEIPGEG